MGKSFNEMQQYTLRELSVLNFDTRELGLLTKF